MKSISFFIYIFGLSYYFIFNSKISTINDGTEDLKLKIFLTNQAINKLKLEISKMNEKVETNTHTQNLLKFKQVNPTSDNTETTSNVNNINITDFNSISEFNNKVLDDDVRRDFAIEKEVLDYFNKNPNHLKIDKIKNDIKENGVKEIEDLIDMLDNHPEKFDHNTQSQFYSENKLNNKTKHNVEEKKENKKLKFKEVDLIQNSSKNFKQIIMNGAIY